MADGDHVDINIQMEEMYFFEPILCWQYIFGISILYLFTTFALTKLVKQNRLIFENNIRNSKLLYYFIKIYNILQIIFNLSIVYSISTNFLFPTIIKTGNFSMINIILTNEMRYYMILYYINKQFDLFDTLFIILKCDFHRLTILHVSHHLFIILTWGYLLSFEKQTRISAAALIQPSLNSLIHFIMYFYYLFSNYQLFKQNKIFVTHAQMIQFIICLIQSIYAYFNDKIVAKYICFIQIFWSLYMIIVFTNFYAKNYFKIQEKQHIK